MLKLYNLLDTLRHFVIRQTFNGLYTAASYFTTWGCNKLVEEVYFEDEILRYLYNYAVLRNL